MKFRIAVFLFAACVGAAFVANRFWTPPPPHVLSGLDRSPSVERDCAGLATEAERAMMRLDLREGSTLSLLATGRDKWNAEPERLFDRQIPIESDELFGKDTENFEKKRQALFADLKHSCEAVAPGTNTPLLRMIQGGITHLRSRGCVVTGSCVFIALTDLEDDSDPQVRKAITLIARSPNATIPPELAGSIDNAGVRVQFVGTSEITPRRSLRHASPEALARLWSVMFTHAELVSFQPYAGQ